MIYYQGSTVSFQEVPDEISLVILIGDCLYKCPGCHSPELQEARGKDLEQDLPALIDAYADVITCVCFMGDGRDPEVLNRCIAYASDRGFKTCLYTGSDHYHGAHLDYLKTGAYVEALGGLDSPITNQCFWQISDGRLIDVTYKFLKNKE